MSLCECGCGKEAGLYANVALGSRRFLHGHNSATHHMSKKNGRYTPEYKAYVAAKSRCTDSQHADWKGYGGRGIKFLFTNIKQFIEELGTRPKGKTLDRKDNNGNYEPGNVKWSTPKQQANNRRKPCQKSRDSNT